MRLYQSPATEDPQLLDWYRLLLSTGDLKTLFQLQFWPLSAFLGYLQPPRTLLFEENAESQLWFAAWTSPVATGVVSLDLWISEPMRHTKEALRAVIDALTFVYLDHHLIVVMTASEAISRMHQHFGFTYVGSVPQLLDGEEAHLSYLTKDAFERACDKYTQLEVH